MDARHALAGVFSLIATVAFAAPAGAATITYNLIGDPAYLTVVAVPPGDSVLDQRLLLTDADTGLGQVPGSVVSVGDTINATLTLSSALTVPYSTAGAAVILELAAVPNNVGIDYTESATYYDGGLQVLPPLGFNNVSGSGGALGLGQIAGDSPTPGFSFDKAIFSATIDSIVDAQIGENLTQTTLTPANPAIEMLTYPQPVPLPAAFWLLLSGIGCLGVLARRTSRSVQVTAH
jgi:hypothetical protein